jgi:hypothetical protein
MKAMFRLLVLVLLLAGWGLAALSLHVVRTPGEVPVTVVTKDRLGLDDIYVDTTKWTIEDVARHRVLVERLIQTGRADVLRHVVDGDEDVARQLTDALARAPREETAAGEPGSESERLARRAGFRWPWEK